MSRLTEIDKPPKPALKSVGPHQFRRIGKFVLACDDSGRFAFLSQAEYLGYLKGLKRGTALRDKLAIAGLMSDSFDFDEAARFAAEKSLLSWPGPSTHLLKLGAAGRAMSLATAKRAVDFAFSAPARDVGLELIPERLESEWGLVWFIVQYARRQGEWRKKAVSLTVRVEAALPARMKEFLDGHRVDLRAVVEIAGPPSVAVPGARRVLARVNAPAEAASGWIDALSEAGVESILLEPSGSAKDFLAFYAAALDRMLQLQGRRDMREERGLGFLSGRRWLLPGHDVLSELCYAPDGSIYSGELAASLDEEARDLLKLGELGSRRFDDLAKGPAVRAVLAASLSENQPMCSQCVYRPFCAVAPSENLRSQGTLWGRHPSSERCALHMALLDILFSRLARTESAEALRQWLS